MLHTAEVALRVLMDGARGLVPAEVAFGKARILIVNQRTRKSWYRAFLLICLSYLLKRKLQNLFPLDLNSIEVLKARELLDYQLHCLLLIEGHVKRYQ